MSAEDVLAPPSPAPAGPPAQPPALPAQPPPHEPRRLPVEFTGRAGEFFGIWIVNVVLTLLTLGIYSAWAKVRTERYFYGNTRIDGTPFEYLATPIQILKGRLVAYAVVVALGISAHFGFLVVYFPLVFAVLLLLPWLLQRALRFRARYSAWRGLRFRFVNGVDDAYLNFMFRPMLQIPTLYMLLPWVRKHQQEYIVTGHRFGGLRFSFQGELGPYYIPFAICLGAGFAAYFVMVLAVFAGALLFDGARTGGETDPNGLMLSVLLPVVVVYLVLLALPVFLRTRYTNLMWGNSRLGPHRFACTLRARDIIWIYLSNGVAILCTLGLAVPWAMVRLAKYRAAHFELLALGDLDEFVAEAERAEGAASAELVDALDLDVGIGL
ncbi:membrane protein [Arenimonas soli]|uniref:Membrane protein n=1 Tax=Arenimonas soli TaxID=2269504 RepID=A0ABQ1HAE5_9GAMM|nr:YjgN family protein [Arenimonas soli]GGA66923.1 membrane protein [Arenimonas soli]